MFMKIVLHLRSSCPSNLQFDSMRIFLLIFSNELLGNFTLRLTMLLVPPLPQPPRLLLLRKPILNRRAFDLFPNITV